MTNRICPWCGEPEDVGPVGWCCQTAYDMEAAYADDDVEHSDDWMREAMALVGVECE